MKQGRLFIFSHHNKRITMSSHYILGIRKHIYKIKVVGCKDIGVTKQNGQVCACRTLDKPVALNPVSFWAFFWKWSSVKQQNLNKTFATIMLSGKTKCISHWLVEVFFCRIWFSSLFLVAKICFGIFFLSLIELVIVWQSGILTGNRTHLHYKEKTKDRKMKNPQERGLIILLHHPKWGCTVLEKLSQSLGIHVGRWRGAGIPSSKLTTGISW